MDILKFRERVEDVLEKYGATFPSGLAELNCVSKITEHAIEYAESFHDDVIKNSKL